MNIINRIIINKKDENRRYHSLNGPAIAYENGEQVWYIHGHCINYEVNKWMIENNYSWPWDKETQVQFELTFMYEEYTQSWVENLRRFLQKYH